MSRFLGSIPFRLRLSKPRGESALCPRCRSSRIELVSRIDDPQERSKREEFFCPDCGCEWDWTFSRPFFAFRARVRPPGWVRID